jgi:hypothetical protein
MKLYGAGVLPFCVTPEGQILFILAKECHVAHWASGSDRWSAFEGGTKKHENEDAVQNAVREFHEESIGVIATDQRLQELRSELYNAQYNLKLCLYSDVYSKQTQSYVKALHVTFIKEFPYDADIEDRFLNIRTTLEQLKRDGERIQCLIESFPQRYPFFIEGQHLTRHSKVFVVSRINGASFSANVFHVEYELIALNEEDTTRVNYRLSYHPRVQDMVDVTNFVTLFVTRKNAHSTFMMNAPIPFGACKVSFSNSGTLQNIVVNKDFLEKARIRYWTMDELHQQIASHNGDIFRPFFNIVLRTTLSKFKPVSSMSSKYTMW